MCVCELKWAQLPRKVGVGVTAQLASFTVTERATSVLEGQKALLKETEWGGHCLHHRDEKT